MKLNKLMQLLKDNTLADGSRSIRSEAADGDGHVYINDVISAYWGANADDLIAALSAHGDKTVHMHINSPGGDVFEARAMAAAVVAYPGKVVSHIDGMCASAATYLALAANEVQMTDGGLLMVHESWTMAYGNKGELRETAALLEKIDGTIASDYQRRTGASLDQVVAWMDATTWFTAQEALEAKFIDGITPNTKREAAQACAQWNLAAYPNAPKLAPPEPDVAALAAAQHQRNQNRLRLFAQI